MKKIINISDEERSRILNLHENATKSHYVNLINEVAAFGTTYKQPEKVIFYTKAAGGEAVAGVLDAGTIWTFDGYKAIAKTAKGTPITYRCDKPAGGVIKGVTYNFTDGIGGKYTQTGVLDAALKKTFCEASSQPKPEAKPEPIRTDVSNPKVKEFQERLNSLPNVISVMGEKLVADGKFGPKTLEAALIALRKLSPESIKSIEPKSVSTGEPTLAEPTNTPTTGNNPTS